MRRGITFRSLFARLRQTPPYPLLDYDENIYTTVVIGSQEWIVENFKSKHYTDGTNIPILSQITENKWHLPSFSEMNGIYMQRVALGMTGYYWSSTESDSTTAYRVDFSTGMFSTTTKGTSHQVRPVREFTSSTNYSLGNTGPAGGIITQKIDNYNSTWTYIEASLTSLSDSAWSNVTSGLIGAAAQTAYGNLNTQGIINQGGHTSSAAKLCNDLAPFGGWANDTDGAMCYYDNLKDIPTGSVLWNGTTNRVVFPDAGGHPSIAGSRVIRFKLWLDQNSGFEAANGLLHFRNPSAATDELWVNIGGYYGDRIEMGTNNSSNGHYITISGLAEKVLDCVILKSTGDIVSFYINGVLQPLSTALLSHVNTPDSYIAYSGTGYLSDVKVWDVQIDGYHKWLGYPNGNLNSAWTDEIGSINGTIEGTVVTYIPDETYGALYNWHSVNSFHGLAYLKKNEIKSEGWRVPSDPDYDKLVAYLGGSSVAGGKLKEAGLDHWLTPNTGATDEYGFKLLPGGTRSYDGSVFSGLNEAGILWTSTEDIDGYSFGKIVSYDSAGISYSYDLKNSGKAVRLVRDLYVTDYDGNVYTYVTIGNQQWMVENFRCERYADGEYIFQLTENSSTNPFTGWTNTSWNTFTSTGLNVTSAIEPGGTTGYARTEFIALNAGDTIRVYYDLTLNSGSTPQIKLIHQMWGEEANWNMIEGTFQSSFTASETANYCIEFRSVIAGTNCSCLFAITKNGQLGWANDTLGAMCYYNNSEATYKSDYGALYNYYAITNAHKLAIPGWRVPSSNDLAILSSFLGINDGGKLKEEGLTHWNSPNTGAVDSYGFKGRGGGWRYAVGTFVNLKDVGAFYKSDDDIYGDYIFSLLNNSAGLSSIGTSINAGASVRLMRDIYVDDYDGNKYTIVRIGTQEWLVENFRCEHFIDGTPIPIVEATDSIDIIDSQSWEDDANWDIFDYASQIIYQAVGSSGTAAHAVLPSITITQHGWFEIFITVTLNSGGNPRLYIYDSLNTVLYNEELTEVDNHIILSSEEFGFELNDSLFLRLSNTDENDDNPYDTDFSIDDCQVKVKGWYEDGMYGDDMGGMMCYYDNQETYKSAYGALYNQYAIFNSHGFGIPGWRVPDNADITTLITYLGGDSVAGGKLKEIGTSHWDTPNLGGIDQYGFKAVGSGVRYPTGPFNYLLFKTNGSLWTSTAGDRLNILNTSIESILFSGADSKTGYCVRLMRDLT